MGDPRKTIQTRIMRAARARPDYRRLLKKARNRGLTPAEYLVKEALERRGCEVIRHGWPDFLVKEPDGRVYALEVKSSEDGINAAQAKLHAMLGEAGFPVRVRVVDALNHPQTAPPHSARS